VGSKLDHSLANLRALVKKLYKHNTILNWQLFELFEEFILNSKITQRGTRQLSRTVSCGNFQTKDCYLFAVTALCTGLYQNYGKKPIKHSVKLVDNPAEIADCTSIDESPGKAYVEVGLINPSAAFVMMLKRIFLK